MLHLVVALENKFQHDEQGEGRNHHRVELELAVPEQLPEPEACHRGVEQGEVHARQEAEDGADILFGRRMERGNRTAFRTEATRCSACHGIVEGVEPVHAAHLVAYHTCSREDEIDHPYPLGARAEAGVQLALDRPGRLCCKHLERTADERRQNGNGKEDYAQATYPLCQRAPEEQPLWKTFGIVHDGGTGGGKARHRLEKGIGEVRDIAADKERQGAEEREYDPCHCHHEVGVPPPDGVVGMPAHEAEARSRGYGDEYCPDERRYIVALIQQ